MYQTLKSTLKITALITVASFATQVLVNAWIFNRFIFDWREYVITALVALVIGGLFFVWRYGERRYYHVLRLYEVQRKRRQLLLREALHDAALRCPSFATCESYKEASKVLDEPSISEELKQDGRWHDFQPLTNH